MTWGPRPAPSPRGAGSPCRACFWHAELQGSVADTVFLSVAETLFLTNLCCFLHV